MGLSVVTPPDLTAFVTSYLTEFKSYARITVTSQDTIAQRALKAAYRRAEKITRRALSPQTLSLSIDSFSDKIELYRAPLTSVTWVKYLDENNSLQTVAPETYEANLTAAPGYVKLAYGQAWPSVYRSDQAVQIRYVAGYVDGGIPDDLLTAIFMFGTFIYDNRGDVSPVEKHPYYVNSHRIFNTHKVRFFPHDELENE